MSWLEWFECLSYVVTIIGLPLGIGIFIYEQRKERQNEEGELYQRLSDEYTNFLKLILENADLQLLRQQRQPQSLTDEQKERKLILFGILVSLFERAYILVYEEKMNKQTRACGSRGKTTCVNGAAAKPALPQARDFRAVLEKLLEGEDEDFQKHIRQIVTQEKLRVNSG